MLEDVLTAVDAGMQTDDRGQYALPVPEQTTTIRVPGLPSQKDRNLGLEFPISESTLSRVEEVAALLE